MNNSTDIQTRRAIESMCLTWRHDYGLNKTGCSMSSGMTESERAVLRNQMANIHEHHVAPLAQEVQRLGRQVESLLAQQQCASANNERIQSAAAALGFKPGTTGSALDFLIARAQGVPAYTAEMGQAARSYIDRCCRSRMTGELLVSPPALPGGFRWAELYAAMLQAGGAKQTDPTGLLSRAAPAELVAHAARPATPHLEA